MQQIHSSVNILSEGFHDEAIFEHPHIHFTEGATPSQLVETAVYLGYYDLGVRHLYVRTVLQLVFYDLGLLLDAANLTSH